MFTTYVTLARPGYWVKNAFMLLGVVLAWFYHPQAAGIGPAGRVAWAFLAVSVIASANYVLNEIFDAGTDRYHPVKRSRPLAAGEVAPGAAWVEYILLAAAGLAMAWLVSRAFFAAGAALLAMGVIYNVPPLRTKQIPYVDVLSESLNNPLRLFLGWFTVSQSEVPPLSLSVAYWMAGAFFMASKRFAEYRMLGPEPAAAYRRSFRWYDEERLIVSMFFYATTAALLLGVFIIRYHLELILSVPLIAGLFSYYLHVALKPASAVQAPERLYRERGLMIYLILCLAVFLGLMLVRIPLLYELLNVPPGEAPSLWRF
jgi:decaprenyl-phosphate phosphoribosyltransferase